MNKACTALAIVLVASRAMAQAAPYTPPQPYAPPGHAPPGYAPPPYYLPPPAPLIPIWISSDVQGLTYELRRPADDATLFFCRSAQCVAYLPPGEYNVYVPPSEEYAEGKRKLKIERPSQLVIDPREASDRTMGLAMGVGGIVLVVAGIAMIVVAAERRCVDGSCDRETPMLLGLAGFATGAVLTPIGWVRFGKSFRPGVRLIETK